MRRCSYCHANVSDNFGGILPFSRNGDRTRNHNALNATVTVKGFTKHRFHPSSHFVVDTSEPRHIEQAPKMRSCSLLVHKKSTLLRCRGDFLITNQVAGELTVDSTVTYFSRFCSTWGRRRCPARNPRR